MSRTNYSVNAMIADRWYRDHLQHLDDIKHSIEREEGNCKCLECAEINLIRSITSRQLDKNKEAKMEISNHKEIFTERENQYFAEILIDIIDKRCEKYERQHRESGEKRVLLEDISFCIKDFWDHLGVGILQEIAKIQGKPRDENWKITAQRMLDSFYHIGEIYVYLSKEEHGVHIDTYRLSREGRLYKYLAHTIRV